MNLVQPAMRRPLMVVVLVIAVVLGAGLALQRMARDIFPPLGIPTIYVAQPYGGMDPAQMEGYLTYYYEYHFLYITGIEHVESKSIQGAATIKLQFYPGPDMPQAMSETVARRRRQRHRRRQHDQPVRQRHARRQISDGAAQFGGQEHQGP